MFFDGTPASSCLVLLFFSGYFSENNMSGEPVMITVETATGAHSSFPVVLKKIMEMPPPNILACDDGT